jgi:hypothetical protein
VEVVAAGLVGMVDLKLSMLAATVQQVKDIPADSVYIITEPQQEHTMAVVVVAAPVLMDTINIIEVRRLEAAKEWPQVLAEQHCTEQVAVQADITIHRTDQRV